MQIAREIISTGAKRHAITKDEANCMLEVREAVQEGGDTFVFTLLLFVRWDGAAKPFRDERAV